MQNTFVKNFLNTVSSTWGEEIVPNNLESLPNRLISFHISTGNVDLNHRLLTTLSAMQKLDKIQFHTITVNDNFESLTVVLSDYFNITDLNQINH